MSLFDALKASGSGMTLARKWMDAVGDNIANINDVSRTDQDAFRQRFVVAQAKDYGSAHDGSTAGGVEVAGVQFGSGEGRLVYDPSNALADAKGYVKMPDIDMNSQMGQLIISQRAYQANAAVVERARASYEAAINIGAK
ncbi:flagellar basal body rod protein FlgC [Quadrisphaera oryzae]|uniref:flagellar basal body rod protein FlgC n=1 Tax=Quadrisphaera TaxID=317661 RepID=UPI001648B49C|nr:flagellar basal body rod C-terminal domain-containing protein [Quadrisphaera sp. RL12-1S]MBC3763770.1 flagellar basal-body rod protein FlgC [Quadrisphaera sp. RL12-1S]